MKDQKTQSTSNKNTGEEFANKNHGPEGVDKAPGEETAGDIENVVAQTQKGKSKNDGDPSEESDRPIEQE